MLQTNKRRKRPGITERTINLSLQQWIRWFSVVSVLLMLELTIIVVLAHNYYTEYPGRIERDSIRATNRSSDSITLSWDETGATDIYRVFYKEAGSGRGDGETKKKEDAGEKEMVGTGWKVARSESAGVTLEGLSEDTQYSVIVRADNSEHEGIPTEERSFRTKRTQSIEVTEQITKLTSSKPFKLDVDADTALTFESDNAAVAEVINDEGEIRINGPGVTEITVKARETRNVEGDEKKVSIEVIESDPVKAGGASAHVIYHLSPDNCEVVKTITGANGAVIPQGLGYTGDKYIVSYGMGNPNRIISFDVDGEGKEVSVPKVALGHPNGFTYADETGLCYCVKGWSSQAITFDPEKDKYGSVNLAYGCSGIGYDRKEKLLYTCSRTTMVAYDISNGFKVVNTCGVVKHSGTTYTQDCGGHAGVLLRCLSGANKHGINYIDLYDMKNGKYLGTISCDLSEVESAIVDEDGFLEILSNNSGSTDYIWRTGINIETIGEGL